MPSNSKSQYRFWRIAARDKEFAAKRGIYQAQAKEWHDADKKKREEDPEWWENLPDKVEKDGGKGNDAEESFEGLFDSIKNLMGMKPSAPKTDIHKLTAELLHDTSKITADTLNNKTIPIGNVGHLLQFKHWPNFRWLSYVEDNLKQFDSWATKFLKLRSKVLREYKKSYEALQKYDDVAEAARLAGMAVTTINAHFDEAFFHLTSDIRKNANFSHVLDSPFNGYKAIRSVPASRGNFPHFIPAISVPEAHKIAELLAKIGEMEEKFDDITENDWSLDDTDDYRWWIRKFPHDDAEISKLLGRFPVAGEYHGLDINQSEIINQMAKGLLEVLQKSLKH